MSHRPHPGSYLVACPHCESGRLEVVKKLWFLRGFVLAARYGTKTVIGCRSCVQSQHWEELVTNLLAGWWSFPWGAVTPFVVLQNIAQLGLPTSDENIEEVLEKVGIDPEEVRVDSRGFTGEQRRMVDAAYAVLGQCLRADERIEAREIEVATVVISQLTGGRISDSEIVDGLLLADGDSIQYTRLSPEYSATLLRMAVGVATSDGTLAGQELGYLRAIAQTLGLGPNAVDELLGETQRQEGARNRGPSHRGTRIRRALDCLGISDPTDILGIKSAYRRLMLRYHPDRAGSDKEEQALHHEKAQELNWAYTYLMEQAELH